MSGDGGVGACHPWADGTVCTRPHGCADTSRPARGLGRGHGRGQTSLMPAHHRTTRLHLIAPSIATKRGLFRCPRSNAYLKEKPSMSCRINMFRRCRRSPGLCGRKRCPKRGLWLRKMPSELSRPTLMYFPANRCARAGSASKPAGRDRAGWPWSARRFSHDELGVVEQAAMRATRYIPEISCAFADLKSRK